MENNNNPRIIDFSQDSYDESAEKETLSPDVEAFKKTVNRMTDIFIVKNHDYGNSFAESVQELGPIAGFSQIMHKFNRLKNIFKGKVALVEGETVEDTLLDMANYCIMLNMELTKRI